MMMKKGRAPRHALPEAAARQPRRLAHPFHRSRKKETDTELWLESRRGRWGWATTT